MHAAFPNPTPPDQLALPRSCGAARRVVRRLPLLAACFLHGAIQTASRADDLSMDYSPAIQAVTEVVQAELGRGALPGATVALVDDQRLVFARGFGQADRKTGRPAAPETVYRVGSISKLFTAVAAMQLRDRGLLAIDDPLARCLPHAGLLMPFVDAPPVTLRQLMCHRSGIFRESPVGGYYDPGQPSAAETIASIRDCAWVHPPGGKTKYSNIGVTLVGAAVEQAARQPFADYQRTHIFEPLRMGSASFVLNENVRQQLGQGYMRVARADRDFHQPDDFRQAEAPLFELGTLPAGNLYCSAPDLARFVMMLLAGGASGGKAVITTETLQEMFTPQLTSEATAFGLGFMVGRYREHKLVSHTGAVYGFTSSLNVLPEQKLGVVVLANDDIAVGPVQKIAHAALSALLQVKLGEAPPAASAGATVAAPLGPADRQQFVGDYESPSYWAQVSLSGDRLVANVSGQFLDLEPSGVDAFVADGRYAQNSPFVFVRDAGGAVVGFTALLQTFARVDSAAAPDIPAAWRSFLGSYGPEFIPLVITVKHGHLYAMTENMFDYRLTPLNRYVFRMPPGLYEDEQLVFQVGPDGHAWAAVLANMTLPRSDSR